MLNILSDDDDDDEVREDDEEQDEDDQPPAKRTRSGRPSTTTKPSPKKGRKKSSPSPRKRKPPAKPREKKETEKKKKEKKEKAEKPRRPGVLIPNDSIQLYDKDPTFETRFVCYSLSSRVKSCFKNLAGSLRLLFSLKPKEMAKMRRLLVMWIDQRSSFKIAKKIVIFHTQNEILKQKSYWK